MTGTKIDYPNVNSKKSNEQNIMALKSYLNELSDLLNYRLDKLESEVDSIKEAIMSGE